MTKTVLIVEDDPVLGKSLKFNIETEGYAVSWVTTISNAYKELEENKIDLMVLDITLPDGSGLDLLKSLRNNGIDTLVIILTAHLDENTVVEALLAGANDYVKKPFSNRELMARILTSFRNQSPRDLSASVTYGNIEVNMAQRRVFSQGTEVKLSRREFDIFTYMLSMEGSVICRNTLMEKLGIDAEVFDRTIDSHISHIRKRIKDSMGGGIKISPVYGVGYRLERTKE